jgi:hypothetical protein
MGAFRFFNTSIFSAEIFLKGFYLYIPLGSNRKHLFDFCLSLMGVNRVH